MKFPALPVNSLADTTLNFERLATAFREGGVGLWGQTPPATQPAKPTGTEAEKLAQVIKVLEEYRLVK
jgi:hypothetical protein